MLPCQKTCPSYREGCHKTCANWLLFQRRQKEQKKKWRAKMLTFQLKTSSMFFWLLPRTQHHLLWHRLCNLRQILRVKSV